MASGSKPTNIGGHGNDTFNVSGGTNNAANNPLVPFFGQPMTAANLINPSERLPHDAINLSEGQDFEELYKGPSPFMAVTIERM